MKIFLDTANLDDIRGANELGVISGVTTNPTLIAREGADFHTRIREILGVISDIPAPWGLVNAEVVASEKDGMIREARELSSISDRVVIKLPMTAEGLRACKVLSRDGIPVNMTLTFSSAQALLAANAGASYVAPFLGRLDDIGSCGALLIAEISGIFKAYGIKTKIVAASVRSPLHVIDAAKNGADIATLPPKVLSQMIKHPLTDSGLEKFMNDWNAAQK